MADPAVDIGTGTTLTFSGFAPEITSISWGGISREIIETSHLGTAPAGANEIGSKTFIAGDLSNPGEITVEGHLDPSIVPPVEGAAASLVITFPSTTTWTANAQMTSFELTVPTEDKMGFTATFKIVDSITVAAAI